MADLQAVVGQIEQDEAATALPIKQRNGKPYLASDGSPATISVIGSESKTYRTKRAEYYRELADAKREEESEVSRIGIAALGVTAWHGWESDGKALPCSAQNVKALLSVDHILYQVESGVARRADFFGADSTG